LRIYPGSYDPDHVTNLLGIAPTKHVRVGETTINPRNGRSRVGRVNGWFLSCEGSIASLDLRRHLDWLLALLEPKAKELGTLQATEGVSMNVICIWWSKHNTGGPTLWPEQMSALSRLNLECGFEFSFDGDEPILGPVLGAHPNR
jgi:hypothetical protein